MHLYDYDFVDEKTAKKEFKEIVFIICAFMIVFAGIAIYWACR